MNFLLTFTTVTIFTVMLSLGISHSIGHLTAVWRERDVVLRSLISVLVLVPIVVVLLLWALDLPPYVVTALAVLASAPGAPLTTTRSQMARADISYVISLQLMLALLAVVVTPIILAIFYAQFELTIERVSPFEVALQIAQVTFMPIIIGLALQRFAPKLVARVSKPLILFAKVLLLLLVVAVIFVIAITPELRQGLNVGGTSLVAILVLVVAAIAIGHLLGGQSPERRAGLAIATLARNVGLALFILGLTAQGGQSIPVLLVFMFVGFVVAIPYGLWIKRQIK